MQRNMAGFTLLEIMIALFILSVGLLGMARMETLSLRYQKDDLFRTIASLQINNLLEEVQVNSKERYQAERVALWRTTTTQLLPRGEGEIQTNGQRQTINIRWRSYEPEQIKMVIPE